MACARLCLSDNVFLFINIAFACYAGALLATGARLAWDPSTYTWFRFLCEAQYRVSLAAVPLGGAWLLALAALGARRRLAPYCAGVALLAVAELAYAAWMGASLAAWWHDSPRAHLARRSMDLLHDLKPALLQFEHYRDVVRPVLDMLEEVEREAPNNVYVIVIFGFLGLILQGSALVMSWRMWRAERGAAAAPRADDGDDSEDEKEAEAEGGWRRAANLRMYTILDKII